MPKTNKLSTAQAKEKALDCTASGLTRAVTLQLIGRSISTWEEWRRSDPEWARRIDSLREGVASARERGVDGENQGLSFATWRKKFLGQDTFRHQQAWVDLLEGRPYTPVEGETYEPSDPNRIIINVPPFHAKSQTMTVEYTTYRICMNPNVRVIIISKRVDQARKFLYSIKQRLTSNQWAPLQAAYAPEGGFKPSRYDGATWGADRIYVNGIDSGEKDPTVEALGLGGQIYGSRADLIIIDDGIVSSNAGQFESQITWLESEVENRAFDGKILVIGTRLATTDLYSELPRGDRYLSGRSPWTVLRQPAVLNYAEDPKDWVTLWPRTTRPMETGQAPGPDGTYEAWDGPRLSRVRDAKPPRVWSLVYQQAEVAEDATFDPLCVNGSVDRRRKPGPLLAGAWGHPRNGAEGQYVIASMDPAMAGDTFTLVGSVDRVSKIRRVLNCWVQARPSPAYIRDLIKNVTEEFGVHEWVIEQNAFQLFLVHDEAIQEYCRNRGVRITPHYCVDTETEVLSKRGWLKSHEVTLGDQILTLNIETEFSEWKPVTDVYRGEYSGPMHKYDHRNIDALCTPDHKWARTDQGYGPMRLVESRLLNTNSVLPLARPLTLDGDPAPSYEDDMVELVGWAVTEGYYRKDSDAVVLSQSTVVNPEKCEKIRSALRSSGAKWSERDNGTNGVHVFWVSGPVARTIRAITGGRKHLPPEFVSSLCERQRKILLDVMVQADGWMAGEASCYCSDERSLVDAFEMLSALSGYPTYTAEHSSGPGHFQSRRKTYNNSFMQNVNTRPVTVKDWSGEIWCPSTENGTFYARRGGKTYFTGNTSRNKQDPDFGVASVAPLFGSTRRINEGAGRAVHAGDNLITLPDPDKSVGVKTLIEELIAWQPGKLGKQLRQDGPMALDVDTPLWSTDGWTTMGGVRVGQRVATPNGSVTRVVAKSAVKRSTVYTVSLDDGSSLDADAGHRWFVTPVDKGGLRLPPRWMTTGEMIARSGDFKRLMLAKPKPVDSPEAALPLDPYVLGVWLGDGDARQGTIYGHQDDTPHIRGHFEDAEVQTTDQKRHQCFGTKGLTSRLRGLGVLKNKHIPEIYLRGSLKQRLALLQGLMDTDGSLMQPSRRVYFGNTNRDLVDGVAFLARSLGFRVNIQADRLKPGMLQLWGAVFTADANTLNPFRLPRKAVLVEAASPQRRPHDYLTVRSIESAGERDVCCIVVEDESHQFLAGRDLVPTGNSLWFFELRARAILLGTDGSGPRKSFMDNPYLSRGDRRNQVVVPVDFFERAYA